MIELPNSLRRDGLSRRLRQELGERDEVPEWNCVFLHVSFWPIGQFLDALLDPDGERLFADGADVFELFGLCRGDGDIACAVAGPVIFAERRVDFDGLDEPFP